MSDDKISSELQQVLQQLKVEEQTEKAARAAGEKETGEKPAGGRENSQKQESKKEKLPKQKGWRAECTTGLTALFIDTILLFAGAYLFGLLYKAFVAYELPTGSDAYASITFYVSPITGVIGILLLLLLKSIYDIRFYRIQDQARAWHEKLKRVTEWVLYVLFMLVFEIVIFVNYSCGTDFFDTYTFENGILGNVAYSLLYIVMPLIYPIEAFIRLLIRTGRDDRKKKKNHGR